MKKGCLLLILAALSFGSWAQKLDDYIELRDGMPRLYRCVHQEHRATVAFVGGSITFNPGWRDSVCAYLKQRWPSVEFRFVTAAIPSLGSVAHVFRLHHDLLDSVKPDLVFYESAVNDRGNGTDGITQVRALEGIVRQIREAAPSSDIVFLSLADPDKTKDYKEGRVPVEVGVHEAVAGHYWFPSINMAKEVWDRIEKGEIDWARDFKDIHPAPAGQSVYYQNVRRLLERGLGGKVPVAQRLQTKMIDPFSFTEGHYYELTNARTDSGWKYEPRWAPGDGLSVRDGFVNVPVLSGTAGGRLDLPFEGTAIGIAVIAGADAGMIRFAVDDGTWQEKDLYTIYSSWLHLPCYYLLGSALKDGPHVLHLQVSDKKNASSKGYVCRIAHFMVNGGSVLQQVPMTLWYTQPGVQWEEALPLGNGRLGMTPDGGLAHERVVLNEITLWSGAPQDANNYNAYKKLPQIRALIAAGKNDEAQAIIDKDFVCTGPGSGGDRYGCFQMMGNLDINFDKAEGTPTGYRRWLSLDSAVAGCSYVLNGVNYSREYFTSYGADVDVIRLTADRPGALSFSVGLSRSERGAVRVEGDRLVLSGQLENGIDGKGMSYAAKVAAKLDGGVSTMEGSKLVIKGANSVILYVTAGTDFKYKDFRVRMDAELAAAMRREYVEERRAHVLAYQRLFNRVKLTIGSAADDEPTDVRLFHYRQQPGTDHLLPVLFFQYGRYLSISSTRVGLLPPNLQGLWANQVHTPWNGDYHLDVNVEMNHWALEAVNLSELNLPLADLVEGMVEHGEKTAKAYYNAKGWVAHVITNPWQFTEPGESASWGISKAGSGWLCNNLWQHYIYTGDLAYLRKIYPVLKGSALFYSSMQVVDSATGWLVTSPASSPENSFYLSDGSGRTASICAGPTIDNQIICELFTNVIGASKTLGVDAAFRAELEAKLKRVPPAGRVSPDGRLMEWLQDYRETDVHHRHVSHLYGLYPAGLITTERTPDLAEACRKTLEARGDDGPSWSIAYKQLWWARLHDGNRAYRLFREIMKPTLKTDINYGAGGGVYPNLLSAGPPFQIDGNFGACAGTAEMLLQSHAGFIELMPAIPDDWSEEGMVSGMKAQGNYTVSYRWKNGRVVDYTISRPSGGVVKVKVNGVIKVVSVTKG